MFLCENQKDFFINKKFLGNNVFFDFRFAKNFGKAEIKLFVLLFAEQNSKPKKFISLSPQSLFYHFVLPHHLF
jgi:hypothetical protein